MSDKLSETLLQINDFFEEDAFIEEALDKVYEHHEPLHEHLLVVTQLVLLVADKLNFDSKYKRILMIASLFHDYGKLKVGKDFLFGARLAKEDPKWEIVKKHPTDSLEIIQELLEKGIIKKQEEKIISMVVELHHAFKDDAYPISIKDEQEFKTYLDSKESKYSDAEVEKIVEFAKILSICDIWEAMTTDSRSYRKGSPNEAEKELRKMFGEDKVIDILIDN